jgi:hypothetical protein
MTLATPNPIEPDVVMEGPLRVNPEPVAVFVWLARSNAHVPVERVTSHAVASRFVAEDDE